MTNYNFNAKKVLMSTIAAVAFSFVFTTNADAIRVKAPQSKTVVQEKKQQQQQKKENKGLIYYLKQTFGVRV